MLYFFLLVVVLFSFLKKINEVNNFRRILELLAKDTKNRKESFIELRKQPGSLKISVPDEKKSVPVPVPDFFMRPVLSPGSRILK